MERTRNWTQIRSSSNSAFVFGRYLEGTDREHFIVAVLNTKRVINAILTVWIVTLDACLVHPPEVFKFAILANASAIIDCHNPPSGSYPGNRCIM
jgi:DNA repair protein RadC